jgi:serine/threonine protein kinase
MADRDVPFRHLSNDDQELLRDVAERFERAWQKAEAGGIVDLDRFLPPRGHPLRTIALHTLIKTDLENRWKRDRACDLEDYLERFPELRPSKDLPAQRIYDEYAVRHRHGDKPALTAYQVRFPAQFATLQKLLREKAPPVITPHAPDGAGVQPESPADAGCYEGQDIGAGYRLRERIRSGSYGEIWRAEGPGSEVAVKILFRPFDHQEAQRLLASLEAVKKLRHPFLLQTLAYWQLEDRLLIVMELADGNLYDCQTECRAAGLPGIPVAELLGYFREVAEALDYLHKRRVLHRDVKPEHILLQSGHAKLGDFSLALIHEHTQRSLSCQGSSGTPAYMAPEVWKGKVSQHSDQYALAISYAELRLGRCLFGDKRDMPSIMFEHLENKINLAGMEPMEEAAVHKALAKDAHQRYPNCTAFLRALEQALAGELPAPPSEATPIPTPAPAEAIPDRGRPLASAAREAHSPGPPWQRSVPLTPGVQPSPPTRPPPPPHGSSRALLWVFFITFVLAFAALLAHLFVTR